jgi:drug/metabolite transporter (DMT)-like permease
LVLVLLAALAHASWNTCAKRLPEGGAAAVWLYQTLSLLLVVPAAAGYAVVTDVRAEPSWVWVVAVGGALQVTYFVLLQRGYARGDLSVVYPLARGTGPMIAVLVALLALGERPGALGIAGAVVVIAGVLVVGSAAAPTPTASRRVGIGYGLASGVFIAGYTLWDAHAVAALGVPPLIQLAGINVTQSLLLTPYVLARRRASLPELLGTRRAEIVTIAVLSPLSYLLVLVAFRFAPVSLVAPAREVSIVIAGVLAWRLLGETNPARRLAGSAVVLAGVVAIALS